MMPQILIASALLAVVFKSEVSTLPARSATVATTTQIASLQSCWLLLQPSN